MPQPQGWHVNKQAHTVNDADGAFVCDLNYVPQYAVALIVNAPRMFDVLVELAKRGSRDAKRIVDEVERS